MKKTILCALVLLSACTFQTKHRAHEFPDDLAPQVENVKTTSALIEKIGAP